MSIVAGLLMAGLLVAQGVQVDAVVIGDSYSSGHGAGDYSDELCMRSDGAAIARVGDFFEGTAVNAACSGAKVADLTEPRIISQTRAGDAECVTDIGGATATLEEGTCTVTLDPQIEATAGATDVFVMIGGNDVGFLPVAAACLLQDDLDQCQLAVDNAKQSVAAAIAEQRRALLAVRDIAPEARLHLVPYPRLFEAAVAADSPVDVLSFQQDWEDQLRQMAGELSDEIGDVYFVETLTPVWEGHGLGAADSWIHTSGSIRDLLHPTPDGWRASGTAFIAHLGLVL
ncbi:GDSL-type esterase/lipase family protein [Flaviflexus huanghaiensis]|uniref:GDSL-type esterase/lipase family protein n=1 Tax=Flaviflexus huanghaiensis TaxID=1111473 RepID=UPI0015F9B35C|nr:GDSL-type esterase/lipase family protein [Flaviflexus huanghaiensis]